MRVVGELHTMGHIQLDMAFLFHQNEVERIMGDLPPRLEEIVEDLIFNYSQFYDFNNDLYYNINTFKNIK